MKCKYTYKGHIFYDNSGTYRQAGTYKYNRANIDTTTKRNAVESMMKKWLDWEIESRYAYSEYYSDLCREGDIAAAMQIKELICDVDTEIKYAERLSVKLANMNYDITNVYLLQDDMHEEYRKKEESLKIDFC